MLTLGVYKLREDAVLPSYGESKASGIDLTLTHVVEKLNSTTVKFGTGIAVQPPEGYYTEIVPRSSIVKKGWMLSNSVGVVDETYRGELFVCLTKIAPEAEDLVLPCKICQLIVRKREKCVVEEIAELVPTERGAGGFGSTDIPKNANVVRYMSHNEMGESIYVERTTWRENGKLKAMIHESTQC